jgi:hypothetical protein
MVDPLPIPGDWLLAKRWMPGSEPLSRLTAADPDELACPSKYDQALLALVTP